MPLTPQDVEAMPTDADARDALYEYGSAARHWVVTGDRAGAMDAAAEKMMALVRQVRASASATEAALRAECEALAVKWERIYNAPVNRGDLFAAELRSVLARIRKETDHE